MVYNKHLNNSTKKLTKLLHKLNSLSMNKTNASILRTLIRIISSFVYM